MQSVFRGSKVGEKLVWALNAKGKTLVLHQKSVTESANGSLFSSRLKAL